MAKKKAGFKLPINPKALLEAVGFADDRSTQEYTLSVLVDTSLEPELLAYAKEAFRPSTANIHLSVQPYFAETVPFAHNSSLVVLLGATAPATGRIMTQALKEQVPAVVVTLDPVLLQTIARETYHEIDNLSIITTAPVTNDAQRFERLFAALGAWMVRELPEERTSLARAFDFVRDPFIANAIQATSVQNAAIAAVFFLPGADLPLLTVNQVKLFSQIAAAYGAELDKGRIQEIAVVLLSGFGFRAIARKLVGALPVFGWAVRGAVGYTGTFAVGVAAHEYFKRGGDISQIAQGLPAGLGPEVNA